MTRPDPLYVLRSRPGWGPAVQQLRSLISRHGDQARRKAEAYARFYAGRRGSMVLDVVLSRQRLYQERVLPLVAKWETDNEAHSVRWLAAHEPDQKRYGLRSGEPATAAALARNLITFADEHGLGDDWHSRAGQQRDEGSAQFPQRPMFSDLGLVAGGFELPPDIGCVQGTAGSGGEDQIMLADRRIRGSPFRGLVFLVGLERVGCHLRQAQCPA
jgi:hypothetical protein